MQVKYGFKLALKCWDWDFLENTKLICLKEMVSEIWLVLFENLVIPNLELHYRGVPYVLKKNYLYLETIWPRVICIGF